MYNSILVPIDGSATAKLGLSEAIKLATSQSSQIRLIHVVNEFVVLSQDASGVNLGQFTADMRRGGEALLNEAESTVRKAGVEVKTVLVEAISGGAGIPILQHAKEWPADLIVCGTHGRRGIRRLLLGSDAEYIVRHTPVPVLLIRAHEPIGE